MNSKDLGALINKCLAPSVPGLEQRPINKVDFEVFKKCLDANLVDLIKELQSKVNDNLKEELFISLVIVIGEQHDVGDWVTDSTEIKDDLINFHRDILLISESLLETRLIICLKKLNVKLKRETWKCHPATIACLTYLANIVMEKFEKISGTFFNLLLPPILLQVDDFEMHYRISGLKLLQKLLESCDQEILCDLGRRDVILDAVKHVLYVKDCNVLHSAIICLGMLVNIPYDISIDKWNTCNEAIDAVLNGMYMETSLNLRSMYMQVLPKFLINIKSRILLWLKRLLLIFQNYMDTSVVDNCIDENTICGVAQCSIIVLQYSKTFVQMYDETVDTFFLILLKLVKINLCQMEKDKALAYLTTALALHLLINTKKLDETKGIFEGWVNDNEYKTQWQRIFNIVDLEKNTGRELECNLNDRFSYYVSIKI